MKLTNRLGWVGLLLLVSLPALADSVDYQTISAAAQKTNDLSRQALVMIFGQVVVDPFAPSEPTLIGSLFAIINGFLGVLAMFWFLTITVKTIVKAGHQGQVFNGGRSALYPIMTFAGFITIVPTQSGWSLAQLTMLWATSVMGIGSANLLTDKAVDMMDSGYSMVTQPTAPSTRSAARGIFEMNLCKYAINSELESLYADGVANTPLMTTKGGNGQYDTGNGSAVCGSAETPNTGRTGTWNLLFDSDVDTSGVITAQHQALDTMQSTLDQAAQAFVDTYLSKRDQDVGSFQNVETQIQNAAAAYENTVNLAINKIDFKDTLQSQLSSQLKSSGWVALGSWYHTFATANNKTNDVAKATPVVTGMSNMGEHGTGDLYNEVFAAYKAQVQNSTYTPPLGTQIAKDDGAAATAADPDSVFVGFFNKPMQKAISSIATWEIGTDASFSNQVNPLIKMQQVGDVTLDVTATLTTVYAVAVGAASATSNSILGKLGGIFAINGGAVAKDVLNSLAPIFFFLMFALMAIGFSLAVFLPAVPFLFWMMGVFNWLVSVLVGCAAGPMWAATHLGAEEDKGSRSAYGYIFLIDMMLRPSLMVLGFFFASVTVVAGGTILNLLFASALANANADSMVGIFKAIGWLMIYARIATFGVTRLFGLQASLADYVISFLGGREGANLMGGMVDNMKGMFGAAGTGAQRAPGIKMQTNKPSEGGNGDGIQ
ncbi:MULTISPECIES: DotA/TraY family protein [Pseudomonas syringae group]|uniref:Conjugal transfer protein n=11 Tax=Pseudomonas syringae group TaxID=136849 RepID=A0A2K4X3T9_PSESX|nr:MULTISPECIES: DotA/TraY family protein [Pseudomonas syringae group]AVB12424.1 conjugal transfer protein [Pseudomonas amygdali pv. morsprunorum]KWS51877.1 conjugal transfer protein [Pseudomonas amygdali pv. morsprunorum]KWS58908.1 conjugal transfer protein [Pseudomonas amygdali pv. morsprunorum]MBI6727625.1 DotA/TraY family protein [Pseudomonas amygdali]MDT3227984.1 DotA/TraY family protein [Pseudomonas amygdali pv. morsprunorum]